MREKFKDVPLGCRIRLTTSSGTRFQGVKVADDVAHDRERRVYCTNIDANEIVNVKYKRPLRVWLIHQSTHLEQLSVTLVKCFTRGAWMPCRWLEKLIQYKLNAEERRALYGEAYAPDVRFKKLQEAYATAHNDWRDRFEAAKDAELSNSGLMKDTHAEYPTVYSSQFVRNTELPG